MLGISESPNEKGKKTDENTEFNNYLVGSNADSQDDDH
jgi:hypothetical protein